MLQARKPSRLMRSTSSPIRSYGLSLAVIGASMKTRAAAALSKGVSLSAMSLWVFGSTVYQTLVLGVPRAELMGAIGMLALAANLASVLLLMRYKKGDANVRSVWLCSRNDAIGNVIVMVAALTVWGTASAWPDLAVAGVMAAIFLSSSVQILRQAWMEYRGNTDAPRVTSTGAGEGRALWRQNYRN
jgi:Co/Zn/Cd efflux system component